MSDKQARMPIPSFKRVYFIGAGFTACQGYPLGGELVARLIEYLATEIAKARRSGGRKEYLGKLREIRKWIGIVQRNYLKAQRAEDVHVGEFYTLVQMLSETPALFGLTASDGKSLPPNLSRDLAAVTMRLFVQICRGEERLKPAQEALLHPDRLKADRHAVVNFNWDEEVDWELTGGRRRRQKSQDVYYTYGSWLSARREDAKRQRPGKRYLLLKPHGSASWYDVAQGLKITDEYFVAEGDPRLPRERRRLVSWETIEIPKLLGGSNLLGLDCPPAITAPTFAKRFEYLEQQLVWRDVIDVCSRASEFIFLGYSLPPDDFLTRAAVRNALRRSARVHIHCLVLCKPPGDPSFQTLLPNFRSVFGREFTVERNLLFCDFGACKNRVAAETFATQVERRLQDAVLTVD